MTREKFDAIWSDEELVKLGLTREEWYQVCCEEDEYINNWADRVRYKFD